MHSPRASRRLAGSALATAVVLGLAMLSGCSDSPVDPLAVSPVGRYELVGCTYGADTVAARTLAMWSDPALLTGLHPTPFGELPGSVVINFATVDALCHAWDLSASLGRPLEFPPEWIPEIKGVVEATCNDAAREHGLIKDVVPTPPDASDTDRLMAQAGRSR